MPKIEDIDAPGILGITDQQLNLLKAVYKISSKNKAASPKEIELTYAKDFGGGIQKSNLFRQMKILQDKDFLTREGEANYKLNLEGLKKTLDQRKTEYQKKIQQYDKLAEEIEEYFRRTTRYEQPMVEYIDGEKELFIRVTQSLKKTNTAYITAKFPGIAYTYPPYMNIGRGEYLQTLMQRCLEKKDLDLIYLTPLDLDYPFGHSMKLFHDREKAIRECEQIISNLENLVGVYDNLHIHYIKNPYGLDVLIPEGKELSECYSFVRDEKMNAIGGIYIKSHEIARQMRETFVFLCSHAQELKKGQGKRICEELRDTLKNLRGDGWNISTKQETTLEGDLQETWMSE